MIAIAVTPRTRAADTVWPETSMDQTSGQRRDGDHDHRDADQIRNRVAMVAVTGGVLRERVGEGLHGVAPQGMRCCRLGRDSWVLHAGTVDGPSALLRHLS